MTRWPAVLLLALALATGRTPLHGRVLDAPPEQTTAPAGLRSLRAPAAAQPVTVVWHADGDTVRVRVTGAGSLPRGEELAVRLLGIDAPEESPRACFADEATAALTRLLPVGGRAFVVPDEVPVDRYGRHLLYAWNADGVLVNEVMVRGGFATALLVEPNDDHIERMRSAEASARDARRGLWGACERPAG